MTYYPLKSDRRYTMAKEFTGAAQAMWVLRFCGEFVDSSAFKSSMMIRALGHKQLLLGQKPIEAM